MNKTILFGLAFSMLAAVNAQWGKKVKGNGDHTTIERSTGDYDAVAVSGWFDVELVSGSEGTLVLEGESNLLEYIETEIKGSELHIRVKKGVDLRPSNRNMGIKVTVPVEEIEGVSLSGSGDIRGNMSIKADKFHSSLSGSGNMTLEVDTDEFIISMSGSGDIHLKGRARQLEVGISGSGDVMAYDLEADDVKASISGSADIEITANQSITARVSGSGDIRYRGNPTKIDSKSSGSGEVSRG